MQISTMIRMTLREVVRRRSVGVALLVLPLGFYLARHEMAGQATRMLVLGLGWVVATLALFSTVNSLSLDRRLRVSGWSIGAIIGGRLLAIMSIGTALGAIFFVLVLIDQDIDRMGAVAGMMACAIVVGSVTGMAVGLLVRRELEGALLLLTVLASQMIADPDGTVAKALPLWSVRQLATYAIDGKQWSYVAEAMTHAVVAAAVGAIVIAVTAAVRLRVLAPAAYIPAARDEATRRRSLVGGDAAPSRE